MGRKKTGKNKSCALCSKERYFTNKRLRVTHLFFCSSVCQKQYWKDNHISWNKGLTKDTDERLKRISKLSREHILNEYKSGARNRFEITKNANQTLRDRTQKYFDMGIINRRVGKRGYVIIYLPLIGKYLEHHYVWEKVNNLKVPDDYVIHHINGDKLDNRIENLELMHKSVHARLHSNERRDLVTGRFL